MNPNRNTILIVAVVLVGCLLASVGHASAQVEAFFGRYEGRVAGQGDDATTDRDLAVTIEPDADGRFLVDWSTATGSADGEVKRKSYRIGFEPTKRPGIYKSTMRADMFGQRVPLDPLKGDPYVWCRIVDGTMTLYALAITDDGAYDLQVYERTLRAGGLYLKFTRMREGDAPKVVTAFLARVGDPPGGR